MQWSQGEWERLEAQTSPHRVFDVHPWLSKARGQLGCSLDGLLNAVHDVDRESADAEVVGTVAGAIRLAKRPFFVLPPGSVFNDPEYVNETRACMQRLAESDCYGHAHGGDLRLSPSELLCKGAVCAVAILRFLWNSGILLASALRWLLLLR